MILTKILSLFLSFCLILEQGVFAQTIDLSRYFANSGKAVIQSDKFRPLHLRYISYDTETNDFQILLDKGDFFNQKTEKTLELEKTSQELMKYFFIGLALPNEKFWVNLRPDSPDNILDPDLEKTDIGRIFLEADLQLKKDTSGMTSPQTPEGNAYWDKLYKKAGELFGSQNITIPTITRPWIVPAETIIGESSEGAYIYKATLKVMLEEDYLRGTKEEGRGTIINYSFNDPRLKELNEYSTQLIKEAIIPKLTYAVNTSKRYAPLRQVYYSLILAQWFKQKYGSLGSASAPVNSYIDLIDSSNLANLTSKEPYDKQAYFRQYQKSFKDGEYNLQEPVYTATGQVIHRYISGGVLVEKIASSTVVLQKNNPHPIRDYLIPISNEAASPVRRSDEEIAQELTDTLLDPARENERLFIWAETVTPKVFKKIVENIESEENQTQENKEIEIRNLIIRILTDTAGLKEETYYSEDKTQKALFREIINDYIAFANMKAPEDENLFASFFSTQIMPINEPENPEPAIIPERQRLKTHMSEYKGRFGITDEIGKYYYKESIETIFNIAKDMKTNLRSEKILNEPTLFLYIWDICLALYLQSAENLTNMDDLLEKMIYSAPKRGEIWHNEIKYWKMKLLKLKPLKIGQEFPYDYESSFKINMTAGAKNLKCIWNKKEEILYIQNSNTGRDIWLQFLGKVNIFYVSWFNENINEFESSKENIPLPADGIIDLTQLTRYEGVRRLLSSSPAAVKMKEDWKKFQRSLYEKELSLPYFRKRELPLETHEFIKELQSGKLRIMFFVLKKNESQFHSYEFYLIDDKPIGYGINELKENNTVGIAMHIFKENRGIYSKDIWEHRLDSLRKIYNDAGIGNKKIKSLLVRPSQFSYSQPYGDIAEGPRALIFYLKRGFRPEAPDLYADINKILQKLENGGERDELFKEAGDDLLKVGINRMLLYLPIDNDKGGIDFSHPEIISRPVSELQSLTSSPLAVNPNLDFEGEWRGIQMVFNAGIRPSARRLAEFAASAATSPGNSQRLNDLRGLVTDLLRRDEEDEKPAPADPALKELLAILALRKV